MNIIKSFGICNIISYNNSIGSFIIAGGNSLKSFLSSCIPNLQFNLFVLNCYSFETKVHSDCRRIILIKNLIRISQKQTRFANRTVPHQN